LVTAGIPGGPIPDGLLPDTTYYWRVESVNDVNPDSPWSSGVMSISLPPRRAYDPAPIDGNKILDLTANLTWTGGWSPIMHNVNFGTDPAALAPVSMMQMDATYDAGPLEPDTTYYWRIDEFYGFETIEGPVWSFSTVPVLPLADDPNLIGQWTFDGDSGGVALDQSGHGGHAALAGNTQIVAGVEGEALQLSGAGDYAEASNHVGVTGGGSRTVSAWIKTAALGEIASWGQDVAGQKWIFRVQGDNGVIGAIRVEVNGGYAVGRIDVRDDEWHHVAAILVDDGSPDIEELALYVDGFLENNSATLDEPVDTADGVVRIGQSPWGTRPFIGLIDDVRIYDKAFTEEEMRQLNGDLAIAWQPQPGIGDSVEVAGVTLSWAPGDGAVEHDVYLGTNADAVAAADASVYRGRQADTTLATELLDFDAAYYWRVDEVTADGTVAAGKVWTFSTAADLTIYGDVTPFDYDTSVDPFLSEISLDLDPAQNWTDPIGRLAVNYTGAAAPGSVTVDEAAGTTTIVGRGADIWGTADEFQYAYTMITGNGSMTVKVDSLAFTDPWTKAGIMIRETLDAGSSFAGVFATGANGVRFQARAMTDQDATSDTSVATDEQKALTAPVWIKIERMFPMISAYYSTDGVNFTPMSWNPQVIPMSPAPIYIGLAVTSHSGAETYAEAVFSELASDGGVAAGPLTSAEIGLTGN
ncbi:MAG: LamG-like jellyroll fold domain-containing protein, partial [Planctomycetota bacterium]